MIVRYDYIDEFFKQDTFSDVDLDNLRHVVETKEYGTSERKSAMSLIEMHLVAYAMGSSLKKPIEPKKIKTKSKKVQENKLKKALRDKTSKSKTSKNKITTKRNKYSEEKNLSKRLSKALKKINSKKSVLYSNQSATNKKEQGKKQNDIRHVDNKTVEISQILKKRGVTETTAKNERSQEYRGSKNTYVKIIYTRMK